MCMTITIVYVSFWVTFLFNLFYMEWNGLTQFYTYVYTSKNIYNYTYTNVNTNYTFTYGVYIYMKYIYIFLIGTQKTIYNHNIVPNNYKGLITKKHFNVLSLRNLYVLHFVVFVTDFKISLWMGNLSCLSFELVALTWTNICEV
jgi:hypothetical protein